MSWPETPRCHSETPRWTTGPVLWDAPESEQRDPTYPYVRPYRTCSYCGSIHPEDLAGYLDNGVATLGGSDWKYGWPHKFYVYGIPNPIAGRKYPSYCYSGRRDSLEKEYPGKVVEEFNHVPDGAKGYRVRISESPAPPTVSAKWYNIHLMDLVGEPEFDRMAALLAKHAKVEFKIVEGRMQYSAPYRGYQADAGRR